MDNKYVISVEGGDGSGKTSVLESIGKFLESQKLDFMITREPGGVRISEEIREVILDTKNTEMDPRTEALLYASARRQHLVEKVYPALEKGKMVIFDRFVDSSLVYQGHCRGIGIDEVLELNQFAIEDFFPSLTIFLDVTPEVGLDRINQNVGREINRLDLENLDFHNKVREGYYIIEKRYSSRFKRVDADQSIEKVLDDVKKIMKEHFDI